MGYIDFKIQRVRKYNRSNGSYQRMRRLLDRKSAQDPTQKPTDASSSDSSTSHNHADASSSDSSTSQNHTDASSSDSSTSHNQNGRGAVYMNTELYEAAKGGDVEDFIAALERVSAEGNLALDTIFDQVSVCEENTYLHVAAMYEKDELVGLILQHFSRKLMYTKNVDGDTALHLATKAGYASIVDLIIRANFHSRLAMAVNEKGNTPLHEALINNHQEVGEIILRWDVLSSYCVNKEGRSGLYLYVEAGNVKNLRTILSYRGLWNLYGHNFMEEQLMNGKSLIHTAILRKNIVTLKEIVAKGMHMLLHVKDENGQTVIEFAASVGFYEGEKYLRDELNKDSTEIDTVDVNQEALQNSPYVLTSSAVGKHDRMRKLFSIQPLPQEDMCHHCMDIDLYEAAKKGDVDSFITALEKFSQERNSPLLPIFNQLSPLGSTFLHVAVSSGNKDLSMFILHYFPKLLNRTDSRGDTALHLAVRARNLDLVEILVRLRNDQQQKEALMDVDLESNDTRFKELMQTVVENEEGHTPLQEALLFKKKKIAECMIKENPEEAYYINKKGTSASYIAVLDGDIDCVKTIMSTTSCYVDKNGLHDQHTKGKSLILAAIWSKKIEMLQELAQGRPILFNLKDEHAQKLLHFAECLGFHEGANYLFNEFKLEILLESIVVDVTPELLQHAYSLDDFSLSVIGMVDLKIESIRQSLHQKGSHRRMKKLISINSLQHFPQYNPDHPSMDLKLYEAAKKGNVPGFIGALEKISEENKLPISTIYNQLTPQGNTFLHVAANFGHEDLTGFIVYYFRKLLNQSNKKGDSALHLAARAGHLGVVDILVRFSNFHQKIHSLLDTEVLRDGGPIGKRRWPMMNRLRNTPLHEAFIYNRGEVIEYLIKANVEEAYNVNNEGKSGLYLAVEAVNVDCVKTILNATSSDIVENVRGELTKGKSIINAAIRGMNIVMLREIARTMPELIHMKDPDEHNPLYYAISTGFLEGVNFLLDEFSICTSKTYSNGFFPVHLASKSGQVHVLQKLLQHCPDAEQFVNRKGQNILHVAAKYGKENVIRFILKTPELELLINEKDNDGNTPLHLATSNWHPIVVSSLSWDRRVNLKLVNDEGFTALDVAEEYMETMTSYRQRLTWSALISAGCPRERSQNAPNNDNVGEKGTSRKNESYMDNYKDRVNTLLLVATLIATVTYAAGLTMPGGYNNSAPHQGMATMLSKQMFQVFVICDTVAMYSAIMVAVTLIWAQLGDLTLVLNALKLALPLLGLSLTMMSVAFMFGVCLVGSEIVWLVHCVLITGIISLASLLALFIPLCFSYTLNSRVLRYISYYLFRLLILASGSYD